MSSAAEKQKIADERRVFQEKWEELYFVTAVRDTTQCLICQQKIAVMKEYNMHRHYKTMHQDKYDAYKGKVREEKVKQLKAAFCKQRSFFANINQSNKDSVRASFVISEMIAKSSQPFTKGLFINDDDDDDVLFMLSNIIKYMQCTLSKA